MYLKANSWPLRLRNYLAIPKVRNSIIGAIGIGALIWIITGIKKNKKRNQSLKRFTNQETNDTQNGTIFNTLDQCSLSNIDDINTMHTNLFLKIDFDKKILIGEVQLKLKAINDITKIQLDSKLLEIQKITVNNNNVQFCVKNKLVPALGDQLEIYTKINKGQEFTIKIEYKTIENKNDEQCALNWLLPSQTFGNTLPFLFTQSEPIYARTLFPCQDSPSVKSTYQVTLSAPSNLTAYASGIKTGEKQQGDHKEYEFKQQIAIPSYLLAICVGDLKQVQVGKRTYVISEPCFVDKCAKEFNDMEQYLQAIEEYLGEYKWQTFVAVVLPKAFPFGGMENPNLTFLSPSLIVGDKSETSVVIHEMVHSWSGNGMTCQNWECFWLNEGVTTFIENKIVGKIFGKDIQNLHAVLGNISLQRDINNIGPNHTYTSLSPKIGQENPDDCFSTVPYVKGSQFLKFIEEQIGEQHMQNFLRILVNQCTVNQETFKQLLSNYVQQYQDITINYAWNDWLNLTGMPQYHLMIEPFVKNKYQEYSQKLFDNILEVEDFNKLQSSEKCYILDLLVQRDITLRIIKNLDEDYGLLDAKNPEIQHRVLIMGIQCQYPDALGSKLSHFLESNGRMKFINKVYRELSKKNPEIGQRLFNLYKNGYHSIAVGQIQKMFKQ